MKINLEITVSRLNINQMLKCDTTQLCVDYGRVLGIDGGSTLWEIGEGDILVPKNDKTYTLKKASEVNSETGDTSKYLNEKGDMAQVEAGQVKYTPNAVVESENVQDAVTELGGNINKLLPLIYAGL